MSQDYIELDSSEKSPKREPKEEPKEKGIRLSNGSMIVHDCSQKKETLFSMSTFDSIVWNELWPETASATHNGSSGPLGFTEFDTDTKIRRHVDISTVRSKVGGQAERRFVQRRFQVLTGVALLDMNDVIYVIPPQTMVTIAPGVPHTWKACPEHICLESVVYGPWYYSRSPVEKNGPPRTESTGKFLMVYEYEKSVESLPTEQIQTLHSVGDYVEPEQYSHEGYMLDLDVRTVLEKCTFIWHNVIGTKEFFEKNRYKLYW